MMTTMSARRRLDRLAQRMTEFGNSAAATTGGRYGLLSVHDDPAHVAQVLETLAECGAVAAVLERAGLTVATVQP